MIEQSQTWMDRLGWEKCTHPMINDGEPFYIQKIGPDLTADEVKELGPAFKRFVEMANG